MAAERHRRRKTDRGWRRLVHDNWYRDLWLFAVTVIALAAILIGNHENHHRINDIQSERARALTLVCEQTNAQNAGIVAFIKASIPPARRHDPATRAYLALASRAFPQTDCPTVVDHNIKR
jgi:hypothetical protein